MVPLLQIETIFCTLFTMFTPSHPCANDNTLKFFFIKMFQTFFCRIKIGCIFIGRITLKRLLFFVKFILQYVLLIFFSFALRFENYTACALRLYLIQSQIHLSSGRSHLPLARRTGILAAVTSLW